MMMTTITMMTTMMMRMMMMMIGHGKGAIRVGQVVEEGSTWVSVRKLVTLVRRGVSLML